MTAAVITLNAGRPTRLDASTLVRAAFELAWLDHQAELAGRTVTLEERLAIAEGIGVDEVIFALEIHGAILHKRADALQQYAKQRGGGD